MIWVHVAKWAIMNGLLCAAKYFAHFKIVFIQSVRSFYFLVLSFFWFDYICTEN